jgi:hypothetical protein
MVEPNNLVSRASSGQFFRLLAERGHKAKPVPWLFAICHRLHRGSTKGAPVGQS